MFRSLLSAAAAAAFATLPFAAGAADHVETPTTAADLPADIADVYLFRSTDATGRVLAAMSFANQSENTGPRVDFGFYCDRNVLYTFNFDRTGDALPDFQVYGRFGLNSAGQCGIQLENVPGAGGTLSGPVGTVLTAPTGLRFYSGRNDDPFFFDTIGFRLTTESFPPTADAGGTIGITNTRDGFRGRNAIFIVFEMDQAAAFGPGNRTLKYWGTTARVTGTTPAAPLPR